MGVIKADKPLEHHCRCPSTLSEETLYIPSEDDRESLSSVRINRRKPSRGQSHSQLTRNDSHLSLKGDWGKKKSRRYHNVSTLVTLAEEDEISEVTINDFVEPTKSPFFQLMEAENGLEKWEEFIASSEEIQKSLISKKKPKCMKKEVKTQLSPQIRQLVKRKNLPLGMLQYLEEQLVDFFVAMPDHVYISPELSSFERLLLHSLSDYHSLCSLSFNKERIRLVRVNNPRNVFLQPPLLLTNYLRSHFNIS